MVNFGYPYNDIVICKDSTDYLGVKGHAGMRPRRNFGRGWGKLKRVPHKTKNNTPTWRKKVAERPSKGRKNSPHKKNVGKKAST